MGRQTFQAQYQGPQHDSFPNVKKPVWPEHGERGRGLALREAGESGETGGRETDQKTHTGRLCIDGLG